MEKLIVIIHKFLCNVGSIHKKCSHLKKNLNKIKIKYQHKHVSLQFFKCMLFCNNTKLESYMFETSKLTQNS